MIFIKGGPFSSRLFFEKYHAPFYSILKLLKLNFYYVVIV